MKNNKPLTILFILIMTLLCLTLYADSPAELIQRFEALPKEEQAKLKKKNSFFEDRMLEQFKELTEGQQNVLIEKYQIDLEKVNEELILIEKMLAKEKKDTEEIRNELGINNKLKTSSKNESNKDKLKNIETKNNQLKKNKDELIEGEEEKSEIELLNEQYRPKKDDRIVLSKITEKDDLSKLKSKHQDELLKSENSDLKNNESSEQINQKQTNMDEISDEDKTILDEIDGKKKNISILKVEEDKKKKEKSNLIDDKIIMVLDQKKENDYNSDYGYDLLEDDEFYPIKNTAVLLQDDYILGPGDELVISLYGSKSNKYTVEILKEGIINIPSIGPIEMSGLTYKEAKLKLTKIISEKMLNTEVFISSGKIKSINVFLLGEFNKPGILKVPSTATMLDALFQSGGIKRIGTLRDLQLKRNGEVLINLDLYDFLQKGISKKGLALQNGDVIFCPILKKSVTVIGAVLRPAKYEVLLENSIKEVLHVAGNITPKAYLKNIKIERNVNNIKRDIIDLDLSLPDSPHWKFEIMDGDIINVSTLIYERSNSVFLAGNVKRPGVYAWSEGLKLSGIIKSVDELLPQTEFSYAVIERISNQKKESFLVSFILENVLIKKTEDIALLPNDKIIIYNVRDFREQPVVKIDGQIVKPGFYEFYEGMKVSDLILAGRGLRDDSYKERADLYRWNDEKSSFEMIIINLKDVAQKNTLLQKRDRLTVHSIWDVVQKEMVESTGFVNKPGKYLYFPGMKVSDLLFASGSLKEYADKSFANIHRKLIDDSGQLTLKYFAVDLEGVLKGDKTADIVLAPKDKLEVLEISKFIKDAKVTIVGEVKSPGSFQWGEGMKISDLLRIAGGLDKSAYLKNAELTHYEIINGEQRFVAHENINLEKVLAGDINENKLLRAYDEVNVLKIPGWNRVATVEIKGEVLYPGVYTIEKGEKITDLIKRAGGLTENAYAFATFFSREKIRISQKEQMDNRADELEKRMLNIKESQSEGDLGKTGNTKDNIRELINKIRTTKVTGRVSLSLELAMKDDLCADNLVLEGNDILIIPKKSDVIYVIGEARNQTTFILNEKLSVKDYILKAGGYTSYADTKNVYIIRADGSVANFKSSGFKSGVLMSNGKKVKGLMAGDTIVIPEKLDQYEGMKLAKDISQIFSQMALSVAAFVAIGVL